MFPMLQMCLLPQMFLMFLALQKLCPETLRVYLGTSVEEVSFVQTTGPVRIDSFPHIPLFSRGECGCNVVGLHLPDAGTLQHSSLGCGDPQS